MTDLEPVPRPDPLAALLRSLVPLGAWVQDAACAEFDDDAAAVFTRDHPDADDLAHAEAVCWRCPVRQECGDYAAQVPSWGLWGADWHTAPARRARAA